MHDDPAYALEAELAARDPALRRKRGVYLTPRPVASYLVRSVDRLLKSEFDMPHGISTPEVRVVEPACGSGVFLREVLSACEQCATRPAVLGFDVLPEACEAARRVVGDAARIVKLDPLAADAEEMERLLGIALFSGGEAERGRQGDTETRGHGEGATKESPCLLVSPSPCLGIGPHSHQSPIPTPHPPLVLLGNPPWANFGRQNKGSWILDQLADYKLGLAEKKNNLGDDFIKFMRWGHYWLDRAGAGVLAFVTSNTYLGGLTHRAMRQSLLASFGDLYFYNLHGSSAKQDRAPDGSRDENLFDIRSGVALCILVKRQDANAARVHYAELRGTRDSKLQTLAESDVSTTDWTPLCPVAPMHFFVPGRGKRSNEYDSFLPLDEIFGEYISGVQTKNDRIFTDFSRDNLAARMEAHLAGGGVPYSPGCLVPYMLAPFDVRWLYYEPRLLGRARHSVMRHMLRPNLGLVFMRQSTTPGEYDHFLVVRTLVSDRVFHSAHGAPFLAPLYLHHDSGRTANLRPDAMRQFAEAWKLFYLPEGHGDLTQAFGPEDVLHYIYAVVHGTEYRRKFDAELRIGIPRVPVLTDRNKVRRLCELGAELVQLHANTILFNRDAQRSATVDADALRCASRLNDVQSFRLGGYDVIRRWVKQRQRRPWTPGDAERLARLIETARETLRLRQLIDESS